MKEKNTKNHATSQGVSSSELLERKFVTNVIKTVIKSSEENLRKAIERADYSAAFRNWLRNTKEWDKSEELKETSKPKNDPLKEYDWIAHINTSTTKDTKGHLLSLRYKKSYMLYADEEILHIANFDHFNWVKWYCPECDKCYPVKYKSLPKELQKRYKEIEKLIKESSEKEKRNDRN